jgi:hypothetical protein
MSRRTKLTIIVLLLVLAAVPAGYVMLTWQIPPPLRFRALTYTPDVDQPEAPLIVRGALTLEIENTSHVPVHVESAGVGLSGVHGNVAFFNPDTPLESTSIVIPGKSVVSARSSWQMHKMSPHGFDGAVADYEWFTRPRSDLVRLYEWVMEKIPADKSRRPPVSKWYQGTTPLVPPPKVIGTEPARE